MLEQREAYVAHLVDCGVCRQLTGQFQTVADLLADSPEEAPEAPGLKDRILALARSDLRAEAGRSPAPIVEEQRVRVGWGRPAWLARNRMAAFAAVLVLAVVGLVAWNVSLQLKLGDPSGLADEQRQLIAAVASGGRVVQLAGTEAAPDASGRLVQSPEGQKSFLLVRSLPRLPAGQEFHVWQISGGVPSRAGHFALTADGRDQLVVLSTNFSGAEAVGVSIEAEGASPTTPMGAIVLLGPFPEN